MLGGNGVRGHRIAQVSDAVFRRHLAGENQRRDLLARRDFKRGIGFDGGAEWLIALGCVLALSDRVQRELRQTNESLLEAQEDLRRVADRDPLTALDNRRTLPGALRSVQPEGALILFFDLDGFKQINDSYGHHAGDLCLKRFAEALRESFRPRDFVVRDHAATGAPHIISIIGAKYTTARRAAEVAIDRITAALGRPAGRCQTASRVLPHAGIADVEGQFIEACRAANVTVEPASCCAFSRPETFSDNSQSICSIGRNSLMS